MWFFDMTFSTIRILAMMWCSVWDNNDLYGACWFYDRMTKEAHSLHIDESERVYLYRVYRFWSWHSNAMARKWFLIWFSIFIGWWMLYFTKINHAWWVYCFVFLNNHEKKPWKSHWPLVIKVVENYWYLNFLFDRIFLYKR